VGATFPSCFVDTVHYTEAGIAAFGTALARRLEPFLAGSTDGQVPHDPPSEACPLLDDSGAG